jgi:hypothetical protein
VEIADFLVSFRMQGFLSRCFDNLGLLRRQANGSGNESGKSGLFLELGGRRPHFRTRLLPGRELARRPWISLPIVARTAI